MRTCAVGLRKQIKNGYQTSEKTENSVVLSAVALHRRRLRQEFFIGTSRERRRPCGGIHRAGACDRAFQHGIFLKRFQQKLGTVKILSREDRRFQAEYTTFRIDSYPVNSGAHTPSDVIFTRDIEKDTLRRDFTVNAIYYSIDTAEYVDYTGGIPDLYKHVLRTTQSPEKVFSEDGLRILRMVRIAAELGFDIDEETLDGAKKSVHLLKDISGERKREEFLKILRADRKYPSDRTKDSEVKALRVLDEIGALEYILPGISAAKGMEQRPDFHVYDVFNHLIETVRYCPPDLRLAGLLHDVGKPLSVQKYGNMHMHAKTGQEIAKKFSAATG